MKKPHEESKDFPKEQIRSAIKLGLAEGEAEKMQKNKHIFKNKKRGIFYTIGAVAAIFMILIGSSHYSPALASSLSQIPIIGSVFGDSDLIGLQQAQEEGLTSQIGETQTMNGISVTLDEILYDQNNITIGYQIESVEELNDYYINPSMDFTIDGESPSGSSGSFGEEIMSPTSRTAMQQITVTDDMPKEFDIGLLLQGEHGENFYFSAPIKQVNDLEKIPVQYSETVDGVELNVTELSYGSSGASISFEAIEDAAESDHNRSRAEFIEFKMVDQDGNEIQSHSGGVQGERENDKMKFTSNKQFDPIDSDVTEVTVTPYLALPTDGGGVEIDEDGKEKELEMNYDDVKEIEFESFTIQIH